mmetsp:Transcript_20520/g.26559  ORF Transcript_20520/g.26559 Transcript_20520/m.26559 type:complete len:419 (-) Transcript_20520:61-1317(-)
MASHVLKRATKIAYSNNFKLNVLTPSISHSLTFSLFPNKSFASEADGKSLQQAYQKSLKVEAKVTTKIDEDSKQELSGKTDQSLNDSLNKTIPPKQSNPQTTIGHFHEFTPKIAVVGVGGAGGNAVNNMIARQLTGVEFLVCNTDAQHLATCLTDNRLQLGTTLTDGLGCGANPDQGRMAAEDSRDEILEKIGHCNMVFITAGMGGGTGTGASPVIAETCLSQGILTVGVLTKPFAFEGTHRMRLALEGLRQMSDCVDTLITIPNQNLFKLVDNKTPLSEAFQIADDVLLAGVKSVTDLMVAPGLINLDFADVKSIMSGMGNAMMGTGQAEGEERAILAAEDALNNPLLGDISIKSAKGVLVNIAGGSDMTLYEVDQAATRITDEIDDECANVIFGSAFDSTLEGSLRVSVVATGIEI